MEFLGLVKVNFNFTLFPIYDTHNTVPLCIYYKEINLGKCVVIWENCSKVTVTSSMPKLGFNA